MKHRALPRMGKSLSLLSWLAVLSLVACAGVKQPLTRRDLEKKILNLQGDIVAHDPTAIKAGNTYYLFTTGKGIPIHCSSDLSNWKTCGQVFDQNPAWAVNTIPGVKDLWAPDIAFFSGMYHLYYAASTFGSNHSAIGLVTNKTLDMQSPDYQWVDEGLVLVYAVR